MGSGCMKFWVDSGAFSCIRCTFPRLEGRIQVRTASFGVSRVDSGALGCTSYTCLFLEWGWGDRLLLCLSCSCLLDCRDRWWECCKIAGVLEGQSMKRSTTLQHKITWRPDDLTETSWSRHCRPRNQKTNVPDMNEQKKVQARTQGYRFTNKMF